jgi:hypothetical protein
MSHESWEIASGAGALVLAAAAYLWLRMPLYRWGCRGCKRIVSVTRFNPGRCTCGTNTLVAFFCGECGSWNTLPTANRHCVACSSRNILVGAEFNFGTRHVRTHNQTFQRSPF